MLKRVVLATAVILFSLPALAFSLSAEQQRLLDANIRYYNYDGTGETCGQTPSSPSADLPTLSDGENEDKAWSYFVSEPANLSGPQAAGVMANLKVESGFDPTNQENAFEDQFDQDVGGWGIGQWTGGRRDNIKAAVIKDLGREYYTNQAISAEMENTLLAYQLNYLYNESIGRDLNPRPHPVIGGPPSAENEWEGLKQTQTTDEATYFWEWHFERPQSPLQAERLAIAVQILDDHSGESGNLQDRSGCGTQVNADTQFQLSPELFTGSAMTSVDAVVLHYTGGTYGGSGAGNASNFYNVINGRGYSVQLYIDQDANVWQMVDQLDTKTSHACGINSYAIGIEIEGNDEGDLLNNAEQKQAVINAVASLAQQFPSIDIYAEDSADVKGILGHSETNGDPVRSGNCANKIDPGSQFLEEVRGAVRNGSGGGQ